MNSLSLVQELQQEKTLHNSSSEQTAFTPPSGRKAVLVRENPETLAQRLSTAGRTIDIPAEKREKLLFSAGV